MGTGTVEREVLTALKKLVAELRHYQIVPIAMLAGEPLGQFSAALAQAKSAIAKAESAPSEWPDDWQPSEPPDDLKAAGEATPLAEYDEMLACIAAILEGHRLNGSTHAHMLRWKIRQSAESAPSVGQQESEKFRHLASAMKKMLPPALLAEVIAHLDPLTPFVEFLRSYDLPASSVAAAPASNVHDRTVNNLRSIASDTTLRSLSAFDRRELLTAAAALEALSAAPAWRAMESAPKDGTHNSLLPRRKD